MRRPTARSLAPFAALGLAGLAVACVSRPGPTVPPRPISPPFVRQGDAPGPGSDPGELIERVVAAHNAERARRRLPPLVESPRLDAAAEVQALDMASRRRMSHKGSDGSSPFDRINRQGYSFRAAAENVAYGFAEVDQVMAGWMHSPGHRRNILGDYAEIGVGRATDASGTAYWSVTFGTPRSGQNPPTGSGRVLSFHLKARRPARSARCRAGKGWPDPCVALQSRSPPL